MHPVAYAAAAVAAVVAASQEQACAAVLALQVILLISSAAQKKLKILQFIPLLTGMASGAVLILSPGLRGRGEMEAASGFEKFAEMSVFQKLLCGFSNYFAFSFFFSLITASVFLVLLCASVREAFNGSQKAKSSRPLSPHLPWCFVSGSTPHIPPSAAQHPTRALKKCSKAAACARSNQRLLCFALFFSAAFLRSLRRS